MDFPIYPSSERTVSFVTPFRRFVVNIKTFYCTIPQALRASSLYTREPLPCPIFHPLTIHQTVRQIPICRGVNPSWIPKKRLSVIIDGKSGNGKYFLQSDTKKSGFPPETLRRKATLFVLEFFLTAGSRTASRKYPRCPRPGCPFLPIGQRGRICEAAGQSSSGTRSRRS